MGEKISWKAVKVRTAERVEGPVLRVQRFRRLQPYFTE
jgi:hypothetical protein